MCLELNLFSSDQEDAFLNIIAIDPGILILNDGETQPPDGHLHGISKWYLYHPTPFKPPSLEGLVHDSILFWKDFAGGFFFRFLKTIAS